MGAALENAHEVESLACVLEAYSSLVSICSAYLIRYLLASHVSLS